MNIFKALAKSLFPQRCAYCGKIISADKLVCEECKNNLPRIKGEICYACGRESDFCSCKGEKYFVSQIAPFYYDGNVRKGLHSFKFRKSQQNAEAFCEEMADAVNERYPNKHFDYIIPVPMTSKSIRQRGYNQVDILCNGVSKLLEITPEKRILTKLYETEKQHGISYLFRKGNLTGVFEVTDPMEVRGKTILLCDDVSTSGETFNECAKMLWLNGAEAVYCVSLALTKREKK